MKRVRFGQAPWQPVLVGKHGEYLMSLTTGMEQVPDPTKSLFSLHIAEEVPGSHLHLNDFNELEHIFLADDKTLVDDGLTMSRLHRHALRTMEVQLTTSVKETEAYITSELRQPAETRRVLCKVYCGKARTGFIAEELGMKVERFSLETGWDFNLENHQSTRTCSYNASMKRNLMKYFLLPNGVSGLGCKPWPVAPRLNRKP